MTWLPEYASVLNLVLLILLALLVSYIFTQYRKNSSQAFYREELNAVRKRADRLQDDSERLMELLADAIRTMTKQTEALSKVSERIDNIE